MKTLIAVDGSAESLCAMRAAAHLVSPIDRHITLLSVVPQVVKRPKGVARRDFQELMLEQANRILSRAHAELPPGAGLVTRRAEVGSVAATIIAQAGDQDLVVIGDKEHGTEGAAGLGPVASRVLEHAPCAVLVGRQIPPLAETDSPRILVAVDGSGASRLAVETLCNGFDIGEAEVCLMHVVEEPWVQFGLEDDWITASEEEQERSLPGAFQLEMMREGEAIVENASRWFHGRRLSITRNIAQGNPSDEILSETERGAYQLIVIGATGSRDLKHRMLGSVSTKVAWNASCSVLVVKEPAESV